MLRIFSTLNKVIMNKTDKDYQELLEFIDFDNYSDIEIQQVIDLWKELKSTISLDTFTRIYYLGWNHGYC
jgi:hypothetical protein